VRALQPALDALVVTGNGASPRVLKDAGAKEADLLLAVTEIDEVNLLAAAAGHRLGVQRTLARVRDAEWFGGDQGFARDILGVDAVIDPEHATADDLAETLLLPGAVHVEHFAEGAITVAEIVIREHSPLAGVVVRERPEPVPYSIVGILRGGAVLVPTAGERVQPGDRVFAVASQEQIAQVVAFLDGAPEEVRDVVVLGGGRVGGHLAKRLAGRCDVRVLERDAERARLLAERVPQALILHEGDLSKEMLLAHGVDRAGAFVACAGDDRTNLLATLHAKQLGARLCLAVVTREQYVPLVDALGVDGAFSLRLTTAEAILRFVRVDTVRAMHLTISGAEVLDLNADPGSAIVGARAEPAGRLSGCEVGAILRDGRVLIPAAGERIQAGDRVLLFRRRGTAARVEHAFDA